MIEHENDYCEENIMYQCETCNKLFTPEQFDRHICRINYNIKTCYRCGREGHYSTDCYAKKHIDGYYLD